MLAGAFVGALLLRHSLALPLGAATVFTVCVRATCLDITERMMAEQALQETTQKFRTIVEEIAERKRVEQALRESEERTRLAMQAGRMFAFEWNPRTAEVRRSYNCADITGSTSDATSHLSETQA
jgi:PAS domain-containing protein